MAKHQHMEVEDDLRTRERIILLILAAVQFTTIVDFMIVMPLAPQLMRTLAISPAQFGMIVSSYTFAAGAAGLVASSIVDRFARRATFMTLNAGFLLGTLACAIAPNYHALIAARVFTGAFGGILGGMTLAIIGDVFPEERRGRATGSLMTGFALASVLGVPFGLYLGTNYGWHVPFVVLAVFGIPALMLTPFALPPLDTHVGKDHGHPLRSLSETFTHTNHLKAFALIVTLMIGSFTVFPFLSAYLVSNVGMTEQQLPLVYIAGGVLTLIASPIIGRLADRYGKLNVYRLVAPGSAVMMLLITHLPPVPTALAIAVFGGLMLCNVGRMIPAMAMVTSSVEPRRRGAFLSANSSVQHMASGLGAYLGGAIVAAGPDGKILHFGTVGWIAAISTLLSLWLAGRIRIVDAGVPSSLATQAVSAEEISLVAAAEATVDVGQPMLGCEVEG
ncbi:MFS transporter [Bythopirellula polymerisocia]|uniref:Purine efflux pump PbuE n=1 Tax=Bythopirellula polymerisocia TaxID=2528003 RepID=A0A5C6CHD6_9BACT|nr:MFS transporter [Bythopirellula polymerisocia]TWU22681.1 Purine efflux pump PbuE [Bythopirellula polymerisocia]